MNPKVTAILVQSIGRNILQVGVGFVGCLWWATNNMEAVGQVKVLVNALAPFLVPLGGFGGIALSVTNSLGLWKEEPPK